MSDYQTISECMAEIEAVLAGDSEGCILHQDCLVIMAGMPDGCVDALITDPPYGVNLGNHGAAQEKRPQWLSKKGYVGYEDTRENFLSIVVPGIVTGLTKATVGLVFVAGTNAWDMPRPAAVGGVYLPAGCGRCAWGFQTLAHFLLYGDCPNLNLGATPISFSSTERAKECEHPCPKPIGWMVWAVNKCTSPGDVVIDPFCGSGTTLEACKRLGRRYIGIDISERYCEIARNRIRDTERPLFI